MTKYRIGELFAGAGGMTLGAKLAGFWHVWANDIDPDACQTLRTNLPLPKDGVACCPVQELDFRGLAPIDGLAFGFPCNDFSVVGERNGTAGHFGALYEWGVRALRHFQPSFFVAENVGGLASTKKGGDLKMILAALSSAGYDIVPHLYRFEEHGVPQARHRIIIVGFREDLGIWFRPPPPRPDRITCREALERPPIPPDAPNNERTRQHPRVVARLGYIKPGQNAFTADIPESLRLRMRSGATISLIYKRLHPGRPAYTVTGSGGGGTHMYHWKEPRALTNRERARLQTFPDWFVFQGGKESVRKQIGMAVPPVGVQAIFDAVLHQLHAAKVRPVADADREIAPSDPRWKTAWRDPSPWGDQLGPPEQSRAEPSVHPHSGQASKFLSAERRAVHGSSGRRQGAGHGGRPGLRQGSPHPGEQ